MGKHILYLIGGSARAGKSSIAMKIRERNLFVAQSPEDLCRPVVKNLFAKTLPDGTENIFFKGEAIYDPPETRKKKPFDFMVPLATSAPKAVKQDILIELPTDYIRFIIRTIFAENRGLSAIGFQGETIFAAKDNKEISRKPINVEIQGEDSVAWEALAGLLSHYDAENQNDIFIEGVAATPENISALNLRNFDLRPVFVGFNNEAYAPTLLAYLQNEAEKKQDYLFWEMRQSGKSDDQFVKDWLHGAVVAGNDLKMRAGKFGYAYFDRTERPNDEHAQTVADFILASDNWR